MNTKLPKWAEKVAWAGIGLMGLIALSTFFRRGEDLAEIRAKGRERLDSIDRMVADQKARDDQKHAKLQALKNAGLDDFKSFFREGFGDAYWFGSVKEITQSNGILQIWTSLSANDKTESSTIDQVAAGYARTDRGKWVSSIVVKDKDSRNLTEHFNIR